MKQDEYNIERITNVDEESFEFGKTTKSETQSFADNKIEIRDEINENPASNSEKPEEEERRKEKKEESSKEESKDNSGGSKGGSSSGASSAVSSVAVAVSASLIVVGTLSTLVGINLTGNGGSNHPESSYGTVNVTNVVPWSYKIGCRLYLTVNGNDKYVVSVSQDDSELSSYELQNGKNEYYFQDLTPETTYSVQVKNVTQNNYVMYQSTINTIAVDEIYPALDLQPDLEEGTFEALLAYEYNDENFSNFALTITDKQNQSKMYRLRGTDEYQTVKLNEEGDEFEFSFDDPDGFDYKISYSYDGVTKSSEVYSIIFDTETPLVKYTITLDSGESTDDNIVYSLRAGKTFTLPENPFTPPEGYVFKCWSKGYAEYNPGMKVIRYLDADYTYTAKYMLDPTPVINSIEFTNEIDFTSDSHRLVVTMDYSDPQYSLYYVQIIFYNPDPEKRAADKNLVVQFSANESQSVYVDETEDFSLCTGKEIEYEIVYNSLGEVYTYRTGTVTFVDYLGREAHVDSFDFLNLNYDDTNDKYTMYWTCEYTDTFESSFYKYAVISLTPYDGGDPYNIYTSSMPASGDISSFDSLYQSFIDYTKVYTYTFGVYDVRDRFYTITSGVLDMQAMLSKVSNFSFTGTYYEVGTKIYLPIQADIVDNTNMYGDLTLTLADNRDSTNPNLYNYSLKKRSGYQVLDISDYPISALTTQDGTVYMISGSNASSYILGPLTADTFSDFGGLYGRYFYGNVNSTVVYEDNLSFDINLFRFDGMDNTFSNLKLVIEDDSGLGIKYTIPANISSFGQGVNDGQIEVSKDNEDYDAIVSLLKSYLVKVSITYDVYSFGATDQYSTTLCSNTVFTVK